MDGLASKPSPVYYKSTGEGSTESTGDAIEAPTEVGNYVAKMTWGKEYNTLTVAVAFSIVPKTYKVNIAETTNGTVSTDKETAQEGETVTLKTEAEDGYELSSLEVEDASGDAVEVTDNAFTMPASDVTVRATFAEKAIEISGEGHTQTDGDVSDKPSGKGVVIGTTGESKRLEAISLKLPKDIKGSIMYRGHSQTRGWMGWAHDGQAAGTAGQSKRAEAVDDDDKLGEYNIPTSILTRAVKR